MLGAVAIVVFAVVAPAPPWVPVVFIAVSVLLNLLALKVAQVLYRRDEARRPAEPAWEPVTRQQVARKILVVVVTFVVVLLLGVVGFGLLFAGASGSRRSADVPLLFAAELGFIGAALACILVTVPLNRQLRENVSRDVTTLRNIAKVVLRNTPMPLDEAQRVAAAKYAVLISVTLPFTLAYICLLYLGLGLQQLRSGTAGPLPNPRVEAEGPAVL